MESGPKYAVSKEGLAKFIVILFGCTAFALFAASGMYEDPAQKTWAFAAYIISWSISFLFYFFHITGLRLFLLLCEKPRAENATGNRLHIVLNQEFENFPSGKVIHELFAILKAKLTY